MRTIYSVGHTGEGDFDCRRTLRWGGKGKRGSNAESDECDGEHGSRSKVDWEVDCDSSLLYFPVALHA